MAGWSWGAGFGARRAVFCFCIALLLSAAAPARAQESTKPQPAQALPSQPQQPAQTPAEPQLPGAEAQVHTGSQFGELSLVGRLARLLADHQIPEMESLLDAPDEAADDPAKKSGAAGKLTPAQKQFFRGVMANRENKPEDSIRLLQPLVNQLAGLKPGAAESEIPDEKLLRKTLAEDYLRAGQFAKAAQAYQDYATQLASSLTPDERDEIELPLRLLPLVAANPTMTVEPGEAFSLPYDRDALGLTDVPVFVDAQSHDWMLDPTAPFNLICRTTAKEVGLKVSEQAATVTTLTGRPIQVHATVIPRFTIGTVTYRNMTAFVFEDADYYFPKSNYQVRGVLGYPAISALGSLTVTASAKIEVQPGEKGEHLIKGARFFLDGDRIIAALGKAGDERMFVIDAGGQQTYLTSRYYAEHTGDFDGKKMQLLAPPGAQGKAAVPAYVAESVALQVGATPVSFSLMQVLTQPLGNAALDDTYGTLGMDALEELKSYTFDYRTMRFAVKSE
jgi:hypothetical protein